MIVNNERSSYDNVKKLKLGHCSMTASNDLIVVDRDLSSPAFQPMPSSHRVLQIKEGVRHQKLRSPKKTP